MDKNKEISEVPVTQDLKLQVYIYVRVMVFRFEK